MTDSLAGHHIPEWQRSGKNIPRAYLLKQYMPSYSPRAAALWGGTAVVAALYLVQPFDWIKNTFFGRQEDEGAKQT